MGRRRQDARHDRRPQTAAVTRRIAVAVVAMVLVVTAEVAATASPAPAGSRPRHATVVAARGSPATYGGEPRVAAGASAPATVRAAAVRFTRDYALWSDGRLRMLPPEDATERVLRLLEQRSRGVRLSPGDASGSVRVRAAGPQRYVVTSLAGNFLLGRHGLRWLVVSLPGE